MESNHNEWHSSLEKMRDPYEIYKIKKEEEDRRILEEEKKSTKKRSGLFGIFGNSKIDEEYQRKLKEKQDKKRKIKDQLFVDVKPFDNFDDSKGIYLFGEPGKDLYH